jgi:hypothetical protein
MVLQSTKKDRLKTTDLEITHVHLNDGTGWYENEAQELFFSAVPS